MWRNQSNPIHALLGCLCAGALLAGTVCGQTPSGIILPAWTDVLAARSINMDVAVYSDAGARLGIDTVQWESADPSVATISSDAKLTGLLPGSTEVIARSLDGTIEARTTVRVWPLRLEIAPGQLEVRVGDTLRPTARVLNADGQPIPGLTLRWSVENPGVARAADGVVIPVAAGVTTVTAAVAGLPAQYGYSAEATLRVWPKRDYRIQRIPTGASAASGTMESFTSLSAAGDVLGAIATTSNGGQVAVIRENGAWRPLLAAGQFSDAVGIMASKIVGISVNARGDAAVMADGPYNWCQRLLVYFPKRGTPELVSNACSGDITPGSLADDGTLQWRMSDGNGGRLMRRDPAGVVTEMFSTMDSPKIATSIDWAVFSRTGTAMFRGTPAGGVSTYYLLEGGKVTAVYKAGDLLDRQAVGNVDVPVAGQDGSYLTRWTSGAGAGLARLAPGPIKNLALSFGTESNPRISWIHNAVDSLGGQTLMVCDLVIDNVWGSSMATISDGKVQQLTRIPSWQGYFDAKLSSTGMVGYVLRTTDTRPILRSFPTNGSPVDLDIRGSLSVPPAADWRFLGRGSEPNRTVAFGAGDALIDFATAGPVVLAKAGSPLSNGKMLTKIDNVASRAGQAVFGGRSDTGGIYRYRNGKLDALFESDNKAYVEGAKFSWVWGHRARYLAINTLGDVAGVAGFDGNDSVFFAPVSGVPRRLANKNLPAPGGGFYSSFDRVEVDDLGQVTFTATASGKAGIFTGSVGNVKRIWTQGDVVLGRAADSLSNLVAAGSKIYVLFGTSTGRMLVAYDKGTWVEIASEGRTSVGGSTLTEFYRTEFTASPSGDVVLLARTNELGLALFGFTASSTRVVASLSDRLPGNEWMLEPQGVSISDKGDIFFSAWVSLDGKEALAFYQASPLN